MLEGGAMTAAKNEAETGTELQMQMVPFPPSTHPSPPA